MEKLLCIPLFLASVFSFSLFIYVLDGFKDAKKLEAKEMHMGLGWWLLGYNLAAITAIGSATALVIGLGFAIGFIHI